MARSRLAIGFRTVDYVFLCDQDGVRTGDKHKVPKGVDAKTIAILLLKSARRKSGGFNRKLIYPQLSYY